MGNTPPSPGEALSPPPGPGPSRRVRLLIASCILLITAVAWAYLVHLNHRMALAATNDAMMMEMGMVVTQPWGIADLFLTFVMWTVMMIGMMAVSALPVLLLFAGLHAQREGRWVVPAFGLGYILMWVSFSACATLVQWVFHEHALLSPSMATSSTLVGGMILTTAGLYQLTPLKTRCLVRCQSPLGFLMTHWRDGTTGAFRMGVRHGVFCLGCCWALMAVLFVVGVMNLVWVGILALFILTEKITFTAGHLSRVAAAILIGLGTALLLGWG